MPEIYGCVIVGAGPAGLGAALYTSRDKLKTLVLEKFYPGGQINNTDRIENYPGIERVSGSDLIEQMHKQITNFGAEIKTSTEVTAFEKLDNSNLLVICGDERFETKTVILAPGSDYRKLGVPGEDEFHKAGAGVSYCGTCDAPFFKGKEVVAVGGGNTALGETLHLTNFTAKVTLVHRRGEFRATRILQDELLTKAKDPGSNLVIEYDTVITAIEGQGKVQSVGLKNIKSGDEKKYPCDGVFIFVGMVPNTEFLKDFVDLTDQGFIKCDCAYLRTNVPGVFAAGDCRIGATMQLVTAVSDGVVAAMMLKQHFRDPHWWGQSVEKIPQASGW